MTSSMPEVIEGERVVLRRLDVDHASELNDLVVANLDRLRPWMPWVSAEPMTVEERVTLIRTWRDSDDRSYGIFVDASGAGGGVLAGVCGLHRRIGAGGVEIGYWIDGGHEGHGFVTEAVGLATAAALAADGVDRVEIRHDRANARSRGVPERLGYEHLGEHPDEVAAPAEDGIEVRWRATRGVWRARPQS